MVTGFQHSLTVLPIYLKKDGINSDDVIIYFVTLYQYKKPCTIYIKYFYSQA